VCRGRVESRLESVTKILVIEDELLIRESIRDLLEARGFQLAVCENGMSGVQLAESYRPDLILCDVEMPDMDGYAVLGKLRQMPVTATIPFIFLTARDAKADIRRGMTLGADDYLTKPFAIEDLVAAIASRLQRQSSVQLQAQQERDRLRSSITLSLPHELRTPITGMFSAIDLLRLFADEPATVRELADSLEASTERMYRLVRNFLLYAQLEIAALEANRPPVLFSEKLDDPEALIRAVANQVARRFEREADLQLALQPMDLWLPETDLEKMIEELLDNAFKFSLAGTPVQILSNLVQIASKSEHKHWAIEVIDQGRGMTPEQIANLGAYIQFDRQIYEQQGMGLGLSITKRLLQRHGGNLVIDSTPDQGTTMRAILPGRL